MKVSSPVGDFPFEPLQITLKPGHLTLEGQVGAWPARVEFEPKDVVTLARAAGPWWVVLPVLPLTAVVLLAGARRWMRRGC
jgi:hypothetical protein